MPEADRREKIRTSPADPGGSLVIIAGATATGKTALAVELAERLDGEIVGAA